MLQLVVDLGLRVIFLSQYELAKVLDKLKHVGQCAISLPKRFEDGRMIRMNAFQRLPTSRTAAALVSVWVTRSPKWKRSFCCQ
jgi:hypothetical protein